MERVGCWMRKFGQDLIGCGFCVFCWLVESIMSFGIVFYSVQVEKENLGYCGFLFLDQENKSRDGWGSFGF